MVESDVLGFYGGFLAFVGTVILGALALRMDRKSYDKDMANTKCPFFIITSVDKIHPIGKSVIYPLPIADRAYHDNIKSKDLFRINLKNIGDGPALNLVNKYENSKFANNNFPVLNNDDMNYYIEITYGEMEKVANNENGVIPISYENIVGYRYIQNIEIGLENIFDLDNDGNPETSEYSELTISFISAQ